MEERRRVHGIDFSGAADAGKKIWIASGLVRGGRLRVEECSRVTERLATEADPERCLPALREFIGRQTESVVGFDFPFSLPRALLHEPTWDTFARGFPARFTSAHEFRTQCFEQAGRRELRRVTDRESRTPWSTYNWRLYRQAYYGIGHVLSPLVRARAVSVVPMHRAAPGLPWLVEVCPASSLKREGLAGSYKGGARAARATLRAARRRILRHFERTVPLTIAPALRRAILDDPGGDALDSVIAAVAAFRALRDLTRAPRSRAAYALEGYVFA